MFLQYNIKHNSLLSMKLHTSIKKASIKFKIPSEVKKILSVLKKYSFQAYIVGGCVRDLLLAKETSDWDLTTNAQPSEIQKLFPESFYDNKFGTVGIPIKDKKGDTVVFEITTFRSEYGYSDHRHPDKISFGKTLGEDLKRRDFTINSMALDGEKIIDLFNGQTDLKERIIRCVGDANTRFREDALRMLRAIRIATQLSFTIENNTLNAIRMNSLLIKNISTERIRVELLKILSSPYSSDGILMLRNCRLLDQILPEVDKCFGVEQKSPKRHHIYDVGMHLIQSLKNCPSKDPVVRLATLLHDVGKAVTYHKDVGGLITFYNHEIVGYSIVRNIADRLHFSNEDKEKLLRLVRWHQFTVDEKQTDKALRRFIKNVGSDYLEDILALRIGDRLGGGATETSWRLELFKKRLIEVQKQPFSLADLKVNGYDVMEIYGIKPGPLVGGVLKIIFKDVVDGKLKNDRKILIKRIADFKGIKTT
jgi:tRNA nucleotidyltransferase (CCA-adding enzyme)